MPSRCGYPRSTSLYIYDGIRGRRLHAQPELPCVLSRRTDVAALRLPPCDCLCADHSRANASAGQRGFTLSSIARPDASRRRVDIREVRCLRRSNRSPRECCSRPFRADASCPPHALRPFCAQITQREAAISRWLDWAYNWLGASSAPVDPLITRHHRRGERACRRACLRECGTLTLTAPGLERLVRRF